MSASELSLPQNLQQQQGVIFTRAPAHLLPLSARSQALALLSGATIFLAQQLPGESGFTLTPAMGGEVWMLSGLEIAVTFCHLLSPSVTGSSLPCRAQ